MEALLPHKSAHVRALVPQAVLQSLELREDLHAVPLVLIVRDDSADEGALEVLRRNQDGVELGEHVG
eukprot:CAMPEP_0195045266 /NCGR_PEP_ID=MMETSP0347-20130606/14343_1 /TAXON_ID=2932 /ORGANISM="Alexandrium fundyense, Strain CCMP1719" /LENGTH=66 /DNA_ID=CAMNT_0040073047 /DNA_START=27 /DNA_END=223 /DNA_ORIENTATION=-